MTKSGENPNNKTGIIELIKSRAGDVAAIAIASVVLIAAGRAGGAALTRLVSDGGRDLARPRPQKAEMFAGEDAESVSRDVPSPPSSELLFAGRTGGSPPGMSYRLVSEVAIDAVVEYYRTEMPRRGWRELDDHSRSYSENYEGVALVFTKGRDGQAMIWISPGEREGLTMITVLSR